MEISIIIVSYNTADLIGPCLESIMKQKGLSHEIFVVDNASRDGSADLIANRYPEVILISNENNRGFAVANNQVLPLCRGRYILFLNPDTFLHEQCLSVAVSYMDCHPEIGLGGLHIVNPDGTDQESVSFRYPNQRYTQDEVEGLPGKIAAVLGAAMIARREALDEVGAFDEAFFLYGEDEDLCLRMRKRGFHIGYIEEARVTHYHGQSERPSTKAEVWRKKIKAELLFCCKHYHPDTIQKMMRLEKLKSWWRIKTLSISLPFATDKKKVREKLERYRIFKEEMGILSNRRDFHDP